MILNKYHFYYTQVDFDLLDAGGVVHHPNYLVLCERARTLALEDAGVSTTTLWNDGIALAVVDAKLNFNRALTMNESICIITHCSGFSAVKLMVNQKIIAASSDKNKITLASPYSDSNLTIEKTNLFFNLDLILACVSLKPLKATRLPETLIQKLALN